jgi:Saxitoxin biosynthesis operon protein SxtJ
VASLFRRANPRASAAEVHHEQLVADDGEVSASDRAVGFVLGAAMAGVGLAPLVRGHAIRPWALAVGTLLFLAAVIRPRWLRPVNRAWMAFGAVANAIVTGVLMALMFYLVITPLGWTLRWLGRDLLRLRLEPTLRSYWLERRPPGPPPETMKNQF